MDKYYTPDISEFHVGFEYEIKEEIGLWSNKYEWIKSELSKGQMCQHLNWLYFIDNKSKYRVKYLDQEDIESLGFEFKTDLYTKGNLTLQVYEDSITIKYYDNINNEWRTKVEQIIIKNKSEFIKLLKMLNIG